MTNVMCGLTHFHSPHAWGRLEWCPGDPDNTDPHLWPEHTAATLLAGLAATRDNDQKARETRLLKEDA